MGDLFINKTVLSVRILFILASLFVFQSSISNPIISEQGHHTIIADGFSCVENTSATREETSLNDKADLSIKSGKLGQECKILLCVIASAAKTSSKYLYHYTSKGAAQSISKNGLRVGKDGFSYLTNNSALKPLQAQIELALPANRALPNSLLRINTSGLSPFRIGRVQGNLPGLGAGGGTEFLFNQTIPASAIKIIR